MGKIENGKNNQYISVQSNGLVISSYTKVYEIIGAQDYANAESILKRSPDQITQLLC